MSNWAVILIVFILFVAGNFKEVDASGGGNMFHTADRLDGGNLRMETGATRSFVYAEETWIKGRRETSGGVSATCMKLLESFSNATSTFLTCIMTNARPLHYCEYCVGEFASVLNTYDSICSDVENGTTCQDELLRADNVQVVLLAYDFVESVWDKSTCHNCYNSTVVNGTTVYRPTDETLEMLQQIEITQFCFRDFADDKPDNATVCVVCKDLYLSANKYYNTLDDEGKLCSDIKDSMNYTRRMWSKEFKCTISMRSDLMIYGIAVAIAFLPITLYIGVFVYGSQQDKKRRTAEEEAADGPSQARYPLNPTESET